MDALNTASSGEQFDADFVWYSAAKTTAVHTRRALWPSHLRAGSFELHGRDSYRRASCRTSQPGDWRRRVGASLGSATGLRNLPFVPHEYRRGRYERQRGAGVVQLRDATVPVEEGERYLIVNRGLFLKASYLKRF